MRFAKLPLRALAIGWAAGLLTCLVVAGCVGLWLLSGGFDVRASTPHSAIVAWGAHTTMRHATADHAKSISAPAEFTPAQVQAGERAYVEHCVMCHGGPGVARAAWTSGLVPTPPYLLDASRRWSSAELFAIIADGVKMTAMPAWKTVQSPDDIWSLVAFLKAMPTLPPASFQAAMRAAGAPAAH